MDPAEKMASFSKEKNFFIHENKIFYYDCDNMTSYSHLFFISACKEPEPTVIIWKSFVYIFGK